MNKLLNQLQAEPFSLLVSLPRNDAELARAAIRGGAQGLKVHINVEHFASGTTFGSFEAEKENLAQIVEAANGVPIGIVPGGAPFASESDFEQLAALGIDFFDAYPADAPSWCLSQRHLGRMLAAYQGVSMDEMRAFEALGMEMCEASILHHDDYGKELNIGDLARYRQLADGLQGPIIVPSQKKVVPRDLEGLKASGVKGLLIGAIVTGREADSLEAATRAFREALG
jgi:hypothetical protein